MGTMVSYDYCLKKEYYVIIYYQNCKETVSLGHVMETELRM